MLLSFREIARKEHPQDALFLAEELVVCQKCGILVRYFFLLMAKKLLCLGGATYDIFLKVEKGQVIRTLTQGSCIEQFALPYGQKVHVEDVHVTLGGGAHNAAVSFARQGHEASLLSVVGQDGYGTVIKENLEKEGIQGNLLQRHATKQTAFSTILSSFEGERTILAYRGASEDLLPDYFTEDALVGTDLLYITSLYTHAAGLLERVRQYKAKYPFQIAWNPGWQELGVGTKAYTEILPLIDVLLLNREEAEYFTGIRLERIAEGNKEAICFVEGTDNEAIPGKHMVSEYLYDYRPMMRFLSTLGPRIVVITDGKRGTQAYDGESYYYIPCGDAQPVDTLGAGDAFGSTFVSSLLHGLSLDEALIRGTLNAGSVIGYYGAQQGLLSLEALQKMEKKSTMKVLKHALVR
jgi:sugar/nucleoside kinase (ribokinase family)